MLPVTEALSQGLSAISGFQAGIQGMLPAASSSENVNHELRLAFDRLLPNNQAMLIAYSQED